jgi:hypothetical protein
MYLIVYAILGGNIAILSQTQMTRSSSRGDQIHSYVHNIVMLALIVPNCKIQLIAKNNVFKNY